MRLRWSICLHINRERAVWIVFECFVLGTQRVALKGVWRKEMMLVVERQRPKAVDRRRLIFWKCYRIAVSSIKPHTARIEVLIVILRFVWRVDQNVRLGHGSSRVIVGAKCGLVGNRRPVVRKLQPVVAELE